MQTLFIGKSWNYANRTTNYFYHFLSSILHAKQAFPGFPWHQKGARINLECGVHIGKTVV